MQTMAPPEEAREESSTQIDERIDRVDERLVDVSRRITEVDRRVTETKEEVKDLKQEVKALNITFQRGNFALVASVVGVLVATLLKGG